MLPRALRIERFVNGAGKVLVWKLWSCTVVWRRENGGFWKRWRRHLMLIWFWSGLRHAPFTWHVSARKRTTSASTTSAECCMDNELQVTQTFFFFASSCRVVKSSILWCCDCLHVQKTSYCSSDLQPSNQLRSRQPVSFFPKPGVCEWSRDVGLQSVCMDVD